ncbi:MAG: DUF2254 domain-containing protein [Comamonadaceae bacterium]|nr:MAG: DUF2254 domain-containing protein [Comamonadaceae bacterium]
MTVPSQVWSRLRGSFWFTPALIVVGSMLLAAALVELGAGVDADLAGWSPRLFGAGADGSRAMLSAIATSMATVAGVVFSITIVTLSLTSTQYSPRVLRNFMRDAPTQVVLGIFVGIFAYCLVVLRTIRGGDEGAFIPSLAVLGGMAYAFVGIGVLIYFIHHVALGIQASAILDRIASDTAHAIDHLFPQQLGEPPATSHGPASLPARWVPVCAQRSGYVKFVDPEALLRVAVEEHRLLRLCISVGDHVPEGAPLAEVAGDAPVPPELAQRVRDCVALGRQRTVEQDAAFGLQQLVDVALRALSPGINDPTTACMCLNELGWLLARLARRAMPEPLRFHEGELRVIAPVPEFGALLMVALAPVIRHSRGDLEVLDAVLRALETVRAAAGRNGRAGALRQVLGEVQIELGRIRPRQRGRALRRRAAGLLAATLQGQGPV